LSSTEPKIVTTSSIEMFVPSLEQFGYRTLDDEIWQNLVDENDGRIGRNHPAVHFHFSKTIQPMIGADVASRNFLVEPVDDFAIRIADRNPDSAAICHYSSPTFFGKTDIPLAIEKTGKIPPLCLSQLRDNGILIESSSMRAKAESLHFVGYRIRTAAKLISQYSQIRMRAWRFVKKLKITFCPAWAFMALLHVDTLTHPTAGVK